MADTITLEAENRATVRNDVKALRRSGKVPAVVYGHNIAPISVQLDTRKVNNTLRKTGRNTLISLSVDGASAPKMVLVREVQRDPVKRTLLHLDFYEVSMTERITATIRVICAGEPADVKSGQGVLLQERDTLEIECLPADLIDSVTVDVSNMNIDDVIRVKDLQIPPGITLREDLEEDVVRLTRFVEAKVEEAAAAEPSEVEVIEKGKKEEDEGEEKK
jgi:large subunit ribosomal protein L25